MELLESIVSFGNDILWSYVLIVMLIVLGVYFTVRTKFVQFRMLGEMIKLLGGGVGASKKGISSFQAFCVSTASRVGTGNLAGVAIAIASGGPGAVFWMWLIALIGSASGFIESTLAQIYKVKDGNVFRGGPAYYMEKALNARWMGVLFAILITTCFGLVFNSVQANTITLAFENAFGFNRAILGIILAAATSVVIFGGIKRIASFTQIIVPIMAGGYIIVALFIVLFNLSEVPVVLATIVKSAFGLQEVVGGGMGAAVMMGIKRGLFSNEAGMGSVPNAAATAEVSHPAKQGLIQALGVFIDTLVICSATAFVIILSGAYTTEGLSGIELTQVALSSHIGDWATSALAITVLMFAFSSVIGNYYYGETNIEFIKNSKTWLTIYRIAVVGMVFFGSVAKISIVWSLADLFMGMMAVVNLIAIALLGKIAFAALKDYNQQRSEGKDPVFQASSIHGISNTECWGDDDNNSNK
ncbi:MAG: alanine:cation symporter family protein [Firmicutes bacterium]|nr:alanine:cation symporter family protein [Bacillota bacterium]